MMELPEELMTKHVEHTGKGTRAEAHAAEECQGFI